MQFGQYPHRAFPAFALLLSNSACDTYYRFESTGIDSGQIRVAGFSYLWDLLFFAMILVVAFGYPLLYRNFTHKEIGRRRIFALRGIIGLVAAAFFYSRTYYNSQHYWDVDVNGVREVSMYGEQEMVWDEAYRVWADRQNVREVTKDMRVPSPMFHAIGPDNRAVIVREEVVGHEAFEGFVQLALDLYYRREVLWRSPPKPAEVENLQSVTPSTAGEYPQ